MLKNQLKLFHFFQNFAANLRFVCFKI